MTVRPLASPVDLTATRALFSEYAASLRIDLAFQDFDTELTTLPGAYVPPVSRSSPPFEVTSKRRKGFPSETRVKRGLRFVHVDKELLPRKAGTQ